jgi:hypothetical protein
MLFLRISETGETLMPSVSMASERKDAKVQHLEKLENSDELAGLSG